MPAVANRSNLLRRALSLRDTTSASYPPSSGAYDSCSRVCRGFFTCSLLFIRSESLGGMHCGVLMGANVANEVAQGDFCETTIGVREHRTPANAGPS